MIVKIPNAERYFASSAHDIPSKGIMLQFHHMYVSHLSLFLFLYKPHAQALYRMPPALAIYSFFIVLTTISPDSDYSDALCPELYL